MSTFVSVKLALSYIGIGCAKSVSNARKSLYGALLGIAVSLVPLIIILVVADGTISGISSRLIELSGSHIAAIKISGRQYDAGTFLDLAEKIPSYDSQNRIVTAWPERQGIGIVVGENGRAGGQIRAVTADFFKAASFDSGLLRFSSGLRESTGFSFSGNEAFMGEKLASDLGLKQGSVFRILTMSVLPNGKTVPKFSVFTLKDTVSSGYQELDALWVFVPFETGYPLLDPSSSSTFISVRTENPFSGLDSMLVLLDRKLPSGFLLRTWEDLNRSRFYSFNTTRLLLLFIGFLILLVAAVNISSAVVMLVLERRGEIAILKSTGASPACISFSFIIAGFLTGLGGLIIGLPTGIVCAIHINGLFRFVERCINMIAGFFRGFKSPDVAALSDVEIHLLDPSCYLETIPVTFDFKALFLISVGTLVLSVLVSLIPAWRAGREKPVEILRKV